MDNGRRGGGRKEGSTWHPLLLNNDVTVMYVWSLLGYKHCWSADSKASTPSLVTICEPRFVADDAGNFILFWICPSGEDQPSVEAQQGMCTYLFESKAVLTCKLPLGNEMSPPTVPPLPSVEWVVYLYDSVLYSLNY